MRYRLLIVGVKSSAPASATPSPAHHPRLTFESPHPPALVEFYETSFGDSSWENVDGWEDMAEELRDWYGLTIDREDNLVRMKVGEARGRRLTSAPPALRGWGSLLLWISVGDISVELSIPCSDTTLEFPSRIGDEARVVDSG